MAICELSGKRPIVKNLVSHSNRKTKKWVQPNIHYKVFFSTTLGKLVRFKVASREIRTVDKLGGIDRYFLKKGYQEHYSPRVKKCYKLILESQQAKKKSL